MSIMERAHESQPLIVTVNGGSSSIKLAVFAVDTAQKLYEAAIENIGQPTVQFVESNNSKPISAHDHTEAAALLIDWLLTRTTKEQVVAVGHRIVHGGPTFSEARVADDGTLATLHELTPFDPEHLPVELNLVQTFQQALPEGHTALCFDTAFHHDLPTRSKLLPVPYHLAEKGVRRYGFHGLSYAYIMEELRRVEGHGAANGKVIIAHLGSGASLTALQNGKPVDTTMSMTPASGIPMSTRSGDLDPGLLLYLSRTEGYDTQRLQYMTNFESGLLGMSETTADMKKLLEIEDEDSRAKNAIDIFCYSVTKTVGAFAAALGGLNSLVFTGGMGENAPKIRARTCRGLDFLGIKLDDQRNQAGERLISADGSNVGVHVIHTDEAVTILRETINLLKQKGWL